MRKIILFLVLLVLISPMVFAAGSQGARESGQETENAEVTEVAQETDQSQVQTGQETETERGQQIQTETETEGEEQTIMTQVREQVRAKNTNELRQMIQQRQQEMNQTMQGLKKAAKNVYQNQNRVRLAVHTLLAMEDLAGGIGQQVSEVARGFNNSVQATIRAEERIQTRSNILRFFMGGDEKSAEELEQEVNQNQQRIQELKQLREQCNEEVKAMMQEQIQNMEQEQTRLQDLAQKEKKSKGLFGWLFK